MNNLRFFLYAFIALSIASGCKKDNETTLEDPITPEPTTVKLPKSITALSATPKTTHFEWDDKNRGTKITYSNGEYSSYTFNGNTVVVKLYVSSEDYFFNGTGSLTSDGNIDKISGTLTINGINYPYSFDGEYDAAGQMIKCTEVENEKTSVYEFTWKDGNMIKCKDFDNGVLTSVTTFDYDTRTNKSPFDINTNFIETTLGITGKHTKNMLTHITRTRVSDNKIISDATYTYELDSEGYITKYTYANAVYNSSSQYQYNY